MGPVIHVTFNLSPCTSACGTSPQLQCVFFLCAFRKCEKNNKKRAAHNYTLFQITALLRRNVLQEANLWMWPLRNEQNSVAVSQQQLSGDEAARTEKGRCVRGDMKMVNLLFLSNIFRANWSFAQVTPPAKPQRQGEKVTTHSAVNLWQQKLRCVD